MRCLALPVLRKHVPVAWALASVIVALVLVLALRVVALVLALRVVALALALEVVALALTVLALLTSLVLVCLTANNSKVPPALGDAAIICIWVLLEVRWFASFDNRNNRTMLRGVRATEHAGGLYLAA